VENRVLGRPVKEYQWVTVATQNAAGADIRLWRAMTYTRQRIDVACSAEMPLRMHHLVSGLGVRF